MTAALVHELTDAEAGVLVECERTIERGLKTFVEVGRALARIRDERLYRTDCPTFEVYCETRWAISRPRAYELMSAAEVVSGIPDTMPKPANAHQAIELGRAPEAERADVWAEARERSNGRPTAATIREVVRERQSAPSTTDSHKTPAGQVSTEPAPPTAPVTAPGQPGTSTPDAGFGGASHATRAPRPLTTPPERPKPPKWDPEERRQHEEDVRRNMAIDAARQQAKTIVTDVLSAVCTVVTGCRYGETGLVTAEMIRELRKAIDLLEGEL